MNNDTDTITILEPGLDSPQAHLLRRRLDKEAADMLALARLPAESADVERERRESWQVIKNLSPANRLRWMAGLPALPEGEGESLTGSAVNAAMEPPISGSEFLAELPEPPAAGTVIPPLDVETCVYELQSEPPVIDEIVKALSWAPFGFPPDFAAGRNQVNVSARTLHTLALRLREHSIRRMGAAARMNNHACSASLDFFLTFRALRLCCAALGQSVPAGREAELLLPD